MGAIRLCNWKIRGFSRSIELLNTNFPFLSHSATTQVSGHMRNHHPSMKTISGYGSLIGRRTFASTLFPRSHAQHTISQPSSDKSVVINIDGTDFSFSPLLLRDLDESPHGTDPSTNQKLFSTADIPAEITVKTIVQGENSVQIQWNNDMPGISPDVVSYVSLDRLRKVVQRSDSNPKVQFSPKENPQILWDAARFETDFMDIEYDSYMKDDATLLRSLLQLHTVGLLFLVNVPESVASVAAITERIGPLKNTFYGLTWDVRSVPDAKNVAYTSQDLGFHMDLLYMHQPPHLQFLHCIRSSSVGGASLFTDAYKSATDLHHENPESFDMLASCDINFHYDHPSSHLYHQVRNVFELDPRPQEQLNSMSRTKTSEYSRNFSTNNIDIADRLAAVSWSPPFQGPFVANAQNMPGSRTHNEQSRLEILNKQLEQWHRAATNFSALIHRADHIYERMMLPGVCVIFDNRRVLHARRAFEPGDAGRERWLRGAYLDKDPFMSKLRVLHHRESSRASK